MKLMPLHKIAAPSPSVLSFLRKQVRHAFDPTTTTLGQRCAYASRAVVKKADVALRSGNIESRANVPCRSFAQRLGGYEDVGATKLNIASSHPRLFARNVPVTSHLTILYRRSFSTTSFTKAWQLFGNRKPRPSHSLPPPPLSEVMGDAPIPLGFEGLGRMTRSANELKMRCTELDDQGNVTMVSGEFKKSELIAKVDCKLTLYKYYIDNVAVRPPPS